MKAINKFLYLLPLILLGACSESFLDTTQTGVQSEETVFSKIENIKAGVTGTYSLLNIQPDGLHNIDVMTIVFGSIASDDAEAGGEQGGNDFIDIQDADKGTTQPSEPKALSDNYWAYHYKGIARANATLSGIATYKKLNSNISATDQKLIDQYEGELYFLLAHFHFTLVQVYGGVPIVDHILSSTEYSMKRDSISRCLHKIEEWCTKASNLLPLKSQYAQADMGRATKGAAQSLLAKAYLYEASYAKNYPNDARFSGCNNTYIQALNSAESVINSNEYELVGINGETFDTYWNQKGSTIYPTKTPGYRYIFTVEGENSRESIFEIQSVNDKQPYMLTRGTYLTVYMAVRNVTGGTLGWGFNCPTNDLLNAYEPNDPRKIVSIGQTGDPVYITSGWRALECKQSPTNMISRKFEASPDQYWNAKSADGNGPNDLYYIRYADVILMAAEAAIETGNASKALTYVNMVRKRARNGSATGIPADLTSCNFEDVVKERRLELAMEGHRFFDLVRWKKQDVLTGQPLQKYLDGKEQPAAFSCQFSSPKNDFFPIPLAEIVASNKGLVQYSGW
jgi:hypothetical protein